MIHRARKGLPVVGFIKIGQPTTKDSARKGAPEKFDHLEFTGTSRDKHGRLEPDIDLIQKILAQGVPTCGGCERSEVLADWFKVPALKEGLPTRCGVFFPYDDLALTFPHDLFYFRGSHVYCKGDMRQAERREVLGEKEINGKKVKQFGAFHPHGPCGAECPDFQERRCKPYAKLKCVLTAQENVGGCYEFRTTSWTSLGNIMDGLEFIQTCTGGILRWIPLQLDVVRTTVTVRATGMRTKPYVLQVTYPDGPQQLRRHVAEMLQVEAPIMAEIKQLEATLVGERAFEELETPVEVDHVRREWPPEVTGDPEPEPAAGAHDEESEIADVGTGAVMREAGADPERVRCTAGWKTLIVAKTKYRAKQLELPPDDTWPTILEAVLTAHGIPELDDVCLDEQESVTEGIERYEMPQ